MPENETADPSEPDEGDIRDFRAAKDEATQARKEADRALRELAFARAGIDTEKGVGKLLFDSYKGEASKDAVLAAANEYGINLTPDTPPVPQVVIDPDERRQTAERGALTAQSEPPNGTEPTPDPKAEALRQFQKGRDEGMRLEDAGAGYIHTLFAAAYNGDKRAQFDPVAHAAKAGEG